MTTPALNSVTPTDLSTLVDALKRELAVPGEFALTFPNTSDDDLTGSLMDSFAQCQLDGFFPNQTLNITNSTVSPGLSAGGGALVLITASQRTLRAQLRALKTSTKYKAGPVEYDVQTSANVLTEELKALESRRKDLLELIFRIARAGRAVYVTDGYLIRAQGYFGAYGLYSQLGFGFYGWELPFFGGGLGSWR